MPSRVHGASDAPPPASDPSALPPADALDQMPEPAPAGSTGRSDRIAALEALDHQQVKPCRLCDLCRARKQTVFGEGDPEARIMFIGEGPGADEDDQGRPFVGRAGQLLDKMINAMGLQREQVYIANVVKCRPPGNRTPTPIETRTCLPYLLSQLRIIRPAVLVTMGNAATQTLLSPKKGITSVRGNWFHFRALEPDGPPIPAMPTFHPAYVLRNYSKMTRGYVWNDLQQVMKLLGMKPPTPRSTDGNADLVPED